MMQLGYGDILQSSCDALVNPVNCDGVMGKGLALKFKQAFPDNYKEYRQSTLAPGSILWCSVPMSSCTIANFPTKNHWFEESKIEYIEAGLQALTKDLVEKYPDIGSIAIPALGCGLGGLRWNDVRPLIVSAFQALPHLCITLYGPQ